MKTDENKSTERKKSKSVSGYNVTAAESGEGATGFACRLYLVDQ